jgi:signal transduction histidine kinase/ActR/RegA family two-component response regulator
MRTVPKAPPAVGAYRADLASPDVPTAGGGGLVPAAVVEELLRTRRELDATLDVTPLAVRVFDVAGVLLRSSAAAEAAVEPPAPRTLRELWERDAPLRASIDVPVGSQPAVAYEDHPAARALRGERVHGESFVVRRREGPRLIETSAGPVLDAAGRVCGAVLVDRDTTERARLARALEEQIRRTMELNERVLGEAEELERMVDARSRELLALQEASARERRLAAVGQLAAGVMHDVNNALNPIIAAAYLLRRHADDPERVRDYADRIAKAAETGAASAARVGRFLRQDPPSDGAGQRGVVVDLATLADEVLAMLQATLADGARGREGRGVGGAIVVEREFAQGISTRGLPGEIREALLNLVQNAVDAMPAGGRLRVIAALVEGQEPECVVAVSDTGAGMTDEVRDRAFEPFFTTKGSAGSGLGLAEVYGIMRRHRGRAEIASAPGRGTTVRLVFPYVPAPERARDGAAGVAGRGGRGRTVLVVEDDEDGREFLHALLTSEGHAVESAAGLAEARLRLGLVAPAAGVGSAVVAPPCDVLLTDIGLADGSGWDLVREARARWPRLRIGAVTGWEAAPPPGAHADRTLRKPLRADELLAFVAATDAAPSDVTNQVSEAAP